MKNDNGVSVSYEYNVKRTVNLFVAKIVNDTMDAGTTKPPGHGIPTVDSITQGVRIIPIRVDPGYPSNPNAAETKPVFGNK